MDVEMLRLLLLLGEAGMTSQTKIAKALGRRRETVHRWLVQRRKPLSLSNRLALLALAGADKDALSRPVMVTGWKAGTALDKFRVKVSAEEIRAAVYGAAVGDPPGAADVVEREV